VAQLGARFHGMEEVIGSNPIRSTNIQQLAGLEGSLRLGLAPELSARTGRIQLSWLYQAFAISMASEIAGAGSLIVFDLTARNPERSSNKLLLIL
jgi:hypothetical protein